jgi:ABC-type bacteriocin/lantibiotic exporter with double-glycine peptidase domain
VEGPASEVVGRAAEDSPLVTFSPGAPDGDWVLLAERARSWLGRAPPLPSAVREGRFRWALVEPLLPAAALSPPSGGAPPTPVRRLASLLAAERSDLGVVLVFAVATGILSLATPLAIQVLINWVAFGALTQPIFGLSAMLLACLLLAAGLRSAQRYVVEILQRRLFVRTVADLSARLARVKVESLDGKSGPELVNRFFDVLTLQKAVASLTLDGLGAALQAGVGLFLLAMYHPVLLVFDVVVVGLAAAVLVPFSGAAQYSAIKESKAKYEVAGWLEQIAQHPMVFKLGGAALAEDRSDHLVRSWLGYRHAHFRTFFQQFVGMQLVQAVVGVALLFTCGWLVIEGQLTLGQLVAAEFVVASALTGLAKFTDKLETVYDLLAGVDKLGSLVDMPHDGTVGVVRRAAGGARVELVGVGLDDGGRELLKDLTFHLVPGGTVALVGDDGRARRFLAELVLGARTPSRGAVSRDGLPYRALRPDHLFAESLLCRPDGLLVGSVYDNLALGRRGVTEEEVWRALASVGLSEEVAALPEGLRTLLHVGGAPLTELQARALLVARALVGEARLVVLDAVLDGLAPAVLDRWLEALGAATAGRTRLVLTSDPAVARRFDRTLWLVDGGVSERPTLRPV